MKFKFRFAVIISIMLHISLFALAFYLPQVQKTGGPIYYVDLMQVPGGGGGGGSGNAGGGGNDTMNGDGETGDMNNTHSTQGELIGSGSIKDLVVKKEKQEPTSSLHYPDKKNKEKSAKQKKEPPSLITVVKKDKDDNKFKKDNAKLITTQRIGTSGTSGTSGTNNGLRTGISSSSRSGGGSGPGSGPGSGGGTGRGFGTGYGDGTGPGSGSGYFPYTYYIETLKSKISSSWYNSLVSPGLKGKFTTIVYFKILRSGSIADLELEQESGNGSLDLSSKRAITVAAPFPPLPSDFPGQYLGVHFEFEWEK